MIPGILRSHFLAVLGKANFLHLVQELTEEKNVFLSYICYKHNSFSILYVRAYPLTNYDKLIMDVYNSCTSEGER